ncbi:porin [Crocinitomix algicola]|uniref:porin n=1 Tax=Crocinitomix algicola TaxID=1740263 RepID=UPI00082A27B6|nr:porin [Crocinitomix algicola]
MTTNYVFLLLIGLIHLAAIGQLDSVKNLKIEGYIEAYYSYDFSNPSDHDRPNFFYSYNRHNEFNLNIGMIKAIYKKNRVKSNLAFMTGTYAKSNLAHEPMIYRKINEANLSVKPFKNRRDWITLGVFPSHIGFESSIGANCYNLTRSISAENSPYYLAGLKYETTSKNKKWFFGVTLANGWQRIQRLQGNQLISLGHQLTCTPNDRLLFNSSSFIGSEFPDSTRRMRYFHDFHTELNLSKKVDLILGFDIGLEQTEVNSNTYSVWYTPTLLTRFSLTNKLSLSTRLEFYEDRDEVIISTIDNQGFATLGYSLNLDYSISEELLFRIEARNLTDRRSIYLSRENQLTQHNPFITSSLSIKF